MCLSAYNSSRPYLSLPGRAAQNARGVSTQEQSPVPIYLDEGMSDAACKMLSGANQFVGEAVGTRQHRRRGDGDTGGSDKGGRTLGMTMGSVKQGEQSGEGGGGSVLHNETEERRRGKRGYDLGLAKARLDRCVVGLLDEWEDTKAVMKHWFPWMEFT